MDNRGERPIVETINASTQVDTSLLSPVETSYFKLLTRQAKFKRVVHEHQVRLLQDPSKVITERSTVLEFTDPKIEAMVNGGSFGAIGIDSATRSTLPRPTLNGISEILNGGYRNCFEYATVQSILAIKDGMAKVTIVPYSEMTEQKKDILNRVGVHNHFGLRYVDPTDNVTYIQSCTGIRCPLEDAINVQNRDTIVDNFLQSRVSESLRTKDNFIRHKSDLRGLANAAAASLAK